MIRYILPFMLIIATVLASCRDDLDYNTISEGEATVSATVKFQPLISSAVQDSESRTAGDAIQKIRNIQVVVYKPNGQYYAIYRYGEGYTDQFTPGTQDKMPSDLSEADQSEAQTMTASFDIKGLPFGRYKMYVVANYPELDEEKIQTPLDLKNHKAEWSEDNVSLNDQMFGYFSTDDQSEYTDAPVIPVDKSSVSINAWIKRLASKLTIVYDGEELYEGINIYIKSVTVRDIPRECVLGFDESQLLPDQESKNINGNSPSSRQELIDDPQNGTLWYKTIYQSVAAEEVDEVETLTTDPAITDYTQWMHITKDVKALGAVSVGADHRYEYEGTGSNAKIKTHQETMQALFFYENCQGDYANPGDPAYNKTPFKEDVGKNEEHEDVYKDRVPFGTFIEVEGYYVSSNPDNQSSGNIKYRFMLGQNTTFNYNALRNRHYKITMKFRGYGNQPEWHIVYEEEEPGLYPLPEYNVSYMYNTRHDMPIRLTGNPYKVTLQIIENNWAPYDPNQTDSVAPATVGTGSDNFRWYKDLYTQTDRNNGTGSANADNSSPRPTNSFDNMYGYYYGLQDPAKYTSFVKYSPAVKYMANEKVTPIWVGFLALQVPKYYDSYNRNLPTGIQDTQGPDNYSRESTITGMRNYYTGKGGLDTGEGNGAAQQSNSTVPLYQCTYDFENNLPGSNNSVQVIARNTLDNSENGSADGRNAATLKNNGDDSYTLTVPLFTMPKSIGYISGFSGNNPYEAYQRRAKVLITAYYKMNTEQGVENVKITKRVPVFQQRRIVNPKGVWRTGDNTESFHVRLMDITSPDATSFRQFDSDGEWSAWVATANDEEIPNTNSFITLSGGDSSEGGKIKGVTGSKIDFTINFNGTTTGSRCAKVIVKYHGNICEHAIFVRQGYNTPLALVDDGVKWSSFSVFSFQGATLTNATANLPSATQNMPAEMTVNPLALGTMYKRGNYGQGIRIINNQTWKVMERVTGPMQLTRLVNGERDDSQTAEWSNILGIANTGTSYTLTAAQQAWQWSTFHSNIVGSTQNYNYDVPTFDDFNKLAAQDFGIGVMYADGASETALTTATAYGYFNYGNTNDMVTSTSGMRGIIVYNRSDFNQIFFPIGYSGVGRRTTQTVPTDADKGYLRYGAVWYRLSTAASTNNQYRPITYNLPANPGAMYWVKQAYNNNGTIITAWDINYFDLSFNGYDASTYGPYGDAIPIKPVIRE